MAEIVLGVGTSHSPMLSIPGELWNEYGAEDHERADLAYPPDGRVLTYDEGVRHVDASIRAKVGTTAEFVAQFARCREALGALADEFTRAKPDVVVIVSDDQEEWFFDSLMPMFAVFWGQSAPVTPRRRSPKHRPEIADRIVAGYGDAHMDVPVAAGLGAHLLGYLADHDFDMAHLTYVLPEYGGRTVQRFPGPDGTREFGHERPSGPQGLPHGYSFVIKNLLGNQPWPIVPIFQNTCYPPNTARPERSYALGEALAAGIAAWDSDLTVAVVGSGGLSHFVTDEELDRALLDALAAKDAQALRALPRQRMLSGTSESLNWITLGGAMSSVGLKFDLVDYVPVYRTEAGTGGGWAFARWV